MDSIAARYGYYIVTGHHSKDYMESVFINLIRGTGIQGLQTLKIFQNNVFRPLLKFTMEEMKQIFEKEQWKIFEDESNSDNKYLRNRIRNTIFPFFLKEGLNPDKIYTNFHNSEDEIFNKSSQLKQSNSYLTIYRNTIHNLPINSLKRLVDFHLEILKLHPIKKQFLFELQSLVNSGGAFTLQNLEIIFWKSKNSDLYLIPYYSKSLQKPKFQYDGNMLTIFWNHKEYKVEYKYEVLSFSPGIKVYNGKFHKEISEVFRENNIPVMVRKNIPILFEKNEPVCVLLNLWDSRLKVYPAYFV